MQIQCIYTYQSLPKDYCQGKTTVVIDVLRATSSIITALAHGATSVTTLAQVEEARQYAATHADTLLAGERGGLKLPGFDFGNSPLELTPETVTSHHIVFCTTNGTAAIASASQAQQIWLGALLNASAVAQKAIDEQISTLLIICSGTEGKISLDDTLAAGAIIDHLYNQLSLEALDLDDASSMAMLLYRNFAGYEKDGILSGLYLCTHGKKLNRLNFAADIDYCAQCNTQNIVPVWDPQKHAFVTT